MGIPRGKMYSTSCSSSWSWSEKLRPFSRARNKRPMSSSRPSTSPSPVPTRALTFVGPRGPFGASGLGDVGFFVRCSVTSARRPALRSVLVGPDAVPTLHRPARCGPELSREDQVLEPAENAARRWSRRQRARLGVVHGLRSLGRGVPIFIGRLALLGRFVRRDHTWLPRRPAPRRFPPSPRRSAPDPGRRGRSSAPGCSG